ncbi:MAG: fimbrillin family protein, partial [Muribaculaceae bacterium]|nr:fimbrillin family protein [Muribaculaceae bacterium]
MKKYLYYVAPLLIAAAAVACSQDDITEIAENNAADGRQEIEFHLDMMSRASDRTIANLDTIWVYADDGSETVFEATPFIKDQYGNFKSEE